MVSIQEATENAMKFARAVLGEGRTAGLRLEEVESTSDAWLITLSMITSDHPMSGIAAALNRPKREYKSFMVNKRDGDVLSMKIRELADA